MNEFYNFYCYECGDLVVGPHKKIDKGKLCMKCSKISNKPMEISEVNKYIKLIEYILGKIPGYNIVQVNRTALRFLKIFLRMNGYEYQEPFFMKQYLLNNKLIMYRFQEASGFSFVKFERLSDFSPFGKALEYLQKGIECLQKNDTISAKACFIESVMEYGKNINKNEFNKLIDKLFTNVDIDYCRHHLIKFLMLVQECLENYKNMLLHI